MLCNDEKVSPMATQLTNKIKCRQCRHN